ncbi:MAG: isoprenylcysteine carboxylmethyltransferase family protein [Acidobacteriaceae bacterium]|nr:isoprenylcysteine carboxylmethyltransferase family protein [Acidobacteriaceae bacterium]
MRATTWEFKNRAFLIGIVFFVGFGLYFVDHENATAVLSNTLERPLGVGADVIARVLYSVATALLALAALIRTWASAYLHSTVVYASELKTDTLVAGGPYRFVRNPLYFANVLLAIGMGTMMSRSGFIVGVLAMLIFCYRLIFREEAELAQAQSSGYLAYSRAVPRLWPSFIARVSDSGQRADWKAGFIAESWYWGFAVALALFTITLRIKWFFIGTAVAVGMLVAFSSFVEKSISRKSVSR